MNKPEIYKVQHELCGHLPFYVYIHEDRDAFVAWGKKNDGPAKQWKNAEAMTLTTRKLGITMHFMKNQFELGLVAHEAVHAALMSMDRDSWPLRKKHRTFTFWNHPEKMAERIGTLTAAVWWMLPEYHPTIEESQVADWVIPHPIGDTLANMAAQAAAYFKAPSPPVDKIQPDYTMKADGSLEKVGMNGL